MEVRFFLEKQRKSIDRMENRRVCMLLCKWPLIIHSMQTSAVHRMTSLKSGKYLLAYCDRRSNSAASDFMLSLPPASSRKKFCILEMTTRSNANHLCVCTVEHNSCESRELHNFIVVYSAFYSLLSLTGDAIKKHEEVPIFSNANSWQIVICSINRCGFPHLRKSLYNGDHSNRIRGEKRSTFEWAFPMESGTWKNMNVVTVGGSVTHPYIRVQHSQWKVMQNTRPRRSRGWREKKRVEKRYHSIVKIVFVVTIACISIVWSTWTTLQRQMIKQINQGRFFFENLSFKSS